jgi:hypothetical protein
MTRLVRLQPGPIPDGRHSRGAHPARGGLGPTRPALALLGAVLLVLLIGCANVAGLLVVDRPTAAASSPFVRLSRRFGGALRRGLLAETLLLALVGGGFALVRPWPSLPCSWRWPPQESAAQDVAVDARASPSA